MAALVQAARIIAAQVRFATFGRAPSPELAFGDTANRPLVGVRVVLLGARRSNIGSSSVRASSTIPAPTCSAAREVSQDSAKPMRNQIHVFSMVLRTPCRQSAGWPMARASVRLAGHRPR